MSNNGKTDWDEEEKNLVSDYATLRSKLDFYLMSVPFVALGMAISSFKPCEKYFIEIEVLAWVLFLLSGLCGLASKLALLELINASLARVRKKNYLSKIPETHHKDIVLNAKTSYVEANENRNHIRLGFYNKFLIISLVLAFVALIISRVYLTIHFGVSHA